MFNFTDARLTGIFAGMFRNGALEATSAGAARHDIAPMVIERDPTTRRITRIETQPHDTPEALLFIERLLRNEAQLSASSQPFSDKGIAENEATAGELDVAPTVPRGNEASASNSMANR